jgi:hypothetical protein
MADPEKADVKKDGKPADRIDGIEMSVLGNSNGTKRVGVDDVDNISKYNCVHFFQVLISLHDCVIFRCDNVYSNPIKSIDCTTMT